MATDAPGVLDHSTQTTYSDPADCADMLDDVEPTIEGVSAVSRNVVAHYRASRDQLPEHSRDDIGLRWIRAILETDQRRNNKPLQQSRSIENRVQGCCRDHTLLAVSALRHHGVPARSRVGFATYLSPTWNHDHVIVEAWLDGRWRRFDPEIDAPREALPDPTDIPSGPDSPFLTAAHVWRGHCEGALDVTRFGVAEGLGIGGDWFVHGYVLMEVAHRFGDELLLWDQWGAMTGDLATAPIDKVELVDELAALMIRADEGDVAAERELLARYRADARLHPGKRVRSFSPNGGAYEVDLAARTVTAVD